jgi:hypothetical protein
MQISGLKSKLELNESKIEKLKDENTQKYKTLKANQRKEERKGDSAAVKSKLFKIFISSKN